MSQVRLRLAAPDDGKFIADSWLRSFKGSNFARGLDPNVYYSEHRKVLVELVERSEVWVACDVKDPWTIWGWMCIEDTPSTLYFHYVYVKSAFRGLDLGTTLAKSALEDHPRRNIVYTHGSKSSQAFLRGLQEAEVFKEDQVITYNPYIPFQDH